MISLRLALLVAAQAAAASPSGPGPAVSPPPAGPVTVAATASKAEVTVGEVFTVDLKATGPAGTRYTFPGEASDDAVELRTPPAGGSAAAPSDPASHRYQASLYALGEVTIPSVPVRYRLPDGTGGQAASAPLTLKVVSLLPKDPQQRKLADIRGPLSVSVGRAFWVALAVALLCAAVLTAWLVRRARRKRAPVVTPVAPMPADAEARAALAALAARSLAARGEYRAFYIELAGVAKRYLERRLSAPVLEMTTAETLAFLRDHPHGDALLAPLRDVAAAADAIKFAKGDGLAAEAERHLAAVRELVTRLEARLQPPAPEGRAA